MRGDRDALAAYAEHDSYEFLRHHQFGGFKAILAQQGRAAQLLFDCMEPIANSRLGHFAQYRLCVEQGESMKFTDAPELVTKVAQRQPERVASTSNNGPAGDRGAANNSHFHRGSS